MLESRRAPGRFTDRLRRVRPAPGPVLAGLCVVVTAAGSGTGRVIATALAARGARLILVDRDPDRLAEVNAAITADGGLARGRRCDLSALGDIDQFVEWVRGEFGGIDVLVNTASAARRTPGAHAPNRFREYQSAMADNYFGPLRLTLGLLPAMRQSGVGMVLNVGPWPHGGSAKTVPDPAAPMSGPEAAWSAFGRCADAELTPHGIRVGAVHSPRDADGAAAARAVETAISARHLPPRVRFARTR